MLNAYFYRELEGQSLVEQLKEAGSVRSRSLLMLSRDGMVLKVQKNVVVEDTLMTVVSKETRTRSKTMQRDLHVVDL